MIDPITAFSAICAGHKAIMKGVQIGRDLSSMGAAVKKYAQGEAELQVGEARKKKSRFSLVEDSAIEKHFKKEALEDMRNELRSIFQLYGKPGQWERLQAEIAAERAEQKRMLAEKARIYDRNITIAVVTGILSVATVVLYYWIEFLKGTL
ncbi:MAG: hypothetical protein CMF58_06625 [Lentimicrobiaceae bacterium]|nr:hypothetical protein [Lentimicrobiaceae bacterium]|tara:strand:+ start:1537 stop:1989 length:453 start_codon:yes stop_codon:yes gene_type:complete